MVKTKAIIIESKKGINWISLLGISLALIGSFILIMDGLPFTYNFINKFGRWKNIKLGLNELSKFDDVIKGNKKVAILNNYQIGFEEILKIIQKYHKNIPNKKVVAILNKTAVSFGDNFTKLNLNVIYLVFAFEQQAFLITAELVLNEYVNRAREKFLYSLGFAFIFAGFFFSFLGYVVNIRYK